MVKRNLRLKTWLCAVLILCPAAAAPENYASVKEQLELPGLSQPVEILKDVWGISHIYAENPKDLFFAQGFNVARDRLFQLEIWRRQATGTLAEILGERALQRDIGARLLKARVDIQDEMNHYHPQGEEIITSFVRGINAYVDLTRKNPELLPMEFELLAIKPHHWTPEVVVSRHNGLFRNARYEIRYAQAVAQLGPKIARELLYLRPGSPQLIPKPGIDLSLLSSDILELYSESRAYLTFSEGDIKDSRPPEIPRRIHIDPEDDSLILLDETRSNERENQDFNLLEGLGSNNWVVSGRHTFSGKPFMANDPHRLQQTPSLRYWVHLHAPGWNVIGGGEPCLPGVSIGHNEYGAWGLTIFGIDQEDLYIYETNPRNPNQYSFRDGWEDMRVFHETISVKGKSPVRAQLKYTRHGPVLYEDPDNHKAYALRAAWLEIGCAPYLASLRMDQARTWEEFREACSYSHTPSENMIWADLEGNIGWQAVGITPLRSGWDGLLPVPGDGSCEWEGFLPIKELPHVFNPPSGYFSTANEFNVPEGYPHKLGFRWGDSFRQARIQEVLGSGRKFTLMDMAELQRDVLSIPARTLVPLLQGLKMPDSKTQAALENLLGWDFRMEIASVAATIYHSWESRIKLNLRDIVLAPQYRKVISSYPLSLSLDVLQAPDGRFGAEPTRDRDAFLVQCLQEAVASLEEKLGPDMAKWRYGQTDYHHILIRHTLSKAVGDELRKKWDIGPAPRPGYGSTVNQTSNSLNQISGASFRIIADLSDWDNSLGCNTPGQSGNPASPHYRDLFPIWAQDKYFPIFFSRAKIEGVTKTSILLTPKR
jgi:penicillin amidase